jgi:prepilin-type N-terminal cleavage/methylation domain-containing protein
MKTGNDRGFTLTETILVTFLMAVALGAAMVMVNKAAASSRAETALQTVTMQLRLAREFAMDRRRIHRVAFTAPRTVTIVRQEIGGNSDVTVSQLDLPSDTQFYRQSGITPTPDQFATTSAVDFGGATTVYFNPDGSAADSTGALVSGIVYIANPGKLETCRAVTLFGATGRVKGFRLQMAGGSWGWQ